MSIYPYRCHVEPLPGGRDFRADVIKAGKVVSSRSGYMRHDEALFWALSEVERLRDAVAFQKTPKPAETPEAAATKREAMAARYVDIETTTRDMLTNAARHWPHDQPLEQWLAFLRIYGQVIESIAEEWNAAQGHSAKMRAALRRLQQFRRRLDEEGIF